MSSVNVHIKDNSDLFAFRPENLSHNLVVAIESNVTNTYIEEVSASTSSLFILVVFASMISWILLEIILELGTVKIDDRLVFSWIPKKCRSCQFYAKNPYLRCAVHPSIVLTKKANSCRDYCHKHQ